MAGKRTQWQRRRPTRALGRVLWTAVVAVFVLGPAWLLFGAEPRDTDGGAVNPFALVVPLAMVLFGSVLAVQILALVRRPSVVVDHYALTVRPGMGRTLVLPWAEIDELATVKVNDEPLLLVRCLPAQRRSADWPRWWDQAHLRAARGATAAVSSYDLAVPLAEFVGSPRSLLEQLSGWAPHRVTVVQRGQYPTP